MLAAVPRPTPPAVAATAQPNIVFIVTDDMRLDQLDHMPIVNSEIVQTGLSFRNAFVSRPLCCPSRTSIFRGQYSHTTGIYTNKTPDGGYHLFHDLGEESSTIATWLDAAGYRTGLVGKYLNEYGPGNTAIPPGWDRWAALDQGNQKIYDYDVNVDGIIQHFGTTPGDYAADVWTSFADDFIRTTRADSPLFLYVGYNAPHSPYEAAPGHATDPACDDVSNLDAPAFNEADVSDKPAAIRSLPPLTSAQEMEFGTTLPQTQCRMLLSVDDGVGRIIAALDDTGRTANTLIVFISDNGLYLGEHRLDDGKDKVYEEDIHVPLVIRYDALGTGVPSSDSRLVMNIDLAPTLVDLLNLSVSPGCPAPPYKGTCSGAFDGQSLMPILDGSVTSWRTDVLLEGTTWCAVRTDRYLFARQATGEEELYDLDQDPFELLNLLHGAVTPETQSLRNDLYARLTTLCFPTPPSFSFQSTAPPVVSGFTPSGGSAGDTVTITGSGFVGVTAVKFNSTSATFTVIDASTISAVVPAAATSGPISVSTMAGTGSSPSGFAVGSGPAITGFTPSSGPTGTKVTITGSGFTGTTSVAFNGASASFTLVSSTKISATVPAGATDGPITVVAAGGATTSSGAFVVAIKTPTVKVSDYSFSPKTAKTSQGGAIRWSFAGPSVHSATDALRLGPSSTALFDSGPRAPGTTYTSTFTAAGTYPYASTQSEPTPMNGTVAVPLIVSPVSGGVTTSFSVRWASVATADFVFDVQSRFRPAGSTTWTAWRTSDSGTTAIAKTFVPDRGAGTYQFRSRVRSASSGRASKYSPSSSVAVT